MTVIGRKCTFNGCNLKIFIKNLKESISTPALLTTPNNIYKVFFSNYTVILNLSFVEITTEFNSIIQHAFLYGKLNKTKINIQLGGPP